MMLRGNDSQAAMVWQILRGVVRKATRRPDELRYHAVRDAWSTAKRFGAPNISNIGVRDLPAVTDMVVEAYFDDPNRAVLAGLCRALSVATFFEIGTNRGRTAWTVARNNPSCQVYTLDLPAQEALSSVALDLNASDRDLFQEPWDRGNAFAGTAEEERIISLHGDSATFDFSPYSRKMDLVLIDGAHSYAYVKNDTERAREILADGGTLVWDDYPAIPGVYTYLNEIASTMTTPLYHIYGTRLVFSSEAKLLQGVFGVHGKQFAA